MFHAEDGSLTTRLVDASVFKGIYRMSQSSDQSEALTAIIFSNVGHIFSHMFTVLYSTAVLYLPKVFGLPYGELLGLSSLGLVLFGVADEST